MSSQEEEVIETESGVPIETHVLHKGTVYTLEQ